MFISICPHCLSDLRLPDDAAGEKIYCLHCRGLIGVRAYPKDRFADTPVEHIDRFETFEEE
jgi:hypothetical protein